MIGDDKCHIDALIENGYTQRENWPAYISIRLNTSGLRSEKHSGRIPVMSQISQLARSIAASPTFALNEEARILRERGEAVINLGSGEPKNRAPIAAILS